MRDSGCLCVRAGSERRLCPLRGASSTTHIIAARDDDGLRSTDIDVVLYIRTATGWDAEAYDPSVSKEDALLDLAGEFGLPDPMDEGWMIEGLDPADVTGNAGVRQAFKTGFFATDPLAEAASAMSNPQPLVETAEAVGIASGGSLGNTGNPVNPIDPQNPCGCADVGCIQNSIAAGVDAGIADSTLTDEEVEAISYQSLQNALPCCVYWVWTSWQGSWSAWDCGPWQFDHSQTLPFGEKDCVYTRTVSRTQQRTRVKRCWSCRIIAAHQTREETCTQETSIRVYVSDPCPDASTVSGSQSCSCSSPSSTGWSPPLPPC